MLRGAGVSAGDEGWRSLFNGRTLEGWRAVPRLFEGLGPGHGLPDEESDRRHREAATRHQARWSVQDEAIVGEQQPAGSGYGGYLVTEDAFDDFELEFEAMPDWPADTGVYLRATPSAARAYQVLIDHRRSGAISGFYGNGIGGFHAVGFTIDAQRDAEGKAVGLGEEAPENSLEPVTEAKRELLSYSASAADLLSAWRWQDWNHYRVRCVGRHPKITVWINGVLASEIDTATLPGDVYDPLGVESLLGPSGRIALEVHDNDIYVASGFDPAEVTYLGPDRWGSGAVCRWRGVRVRDISSD
jgi:hypothetical protein